MKAQAIFKQRKFMDKNQYLLNIWKLCAVTLVAIFLSVSGCVYGQSEQVKTLILAGKDPILSMCAIHGTEGSLAAPCTAALLVAK